MLVWLLTQVISTTAISCYAGQHKHLQPASLDKYDCPERAGCFVFIYATSNETQISNETDVSQLEAIIDRGCLEESEVPVFTSEIQCRQLLSLSKRLTASELVQGQRCACTSDFCNSAVAKKFLLFLAILLPFTSW